jgi:hypothetical protein
VCKPNNLAAAADDLPGLLSSSLPTKFNEHGESQQRSHNLLLSNHTKLTIEAKSSWVAVGSSLNGSTIAVIAGARMLGADLSVAE